MITLCCAACLKSFDRKYSDYARTVKWRGAAKFFCSRTCYFASQKAELHIPENDSQRIFYTIDLNRDEYTPFRWYIGHAKSRSKKNSCGCDITVEYLKEIFERQNGLCPFTGWKLTLPKSVEGFPEGRNPTNASLDRIDNSKGYVCGNVRFVSLMANFGRNIFTDEQLIAFCKSVAIQHSANVETNLPIEDVKSFQESTERCFYRTRKNRHKRKRKT